MGYIKEKLGIEKTEVINFNVKTTIHDVLILLAKKHGKSFKKSVYDPKDPELKPYHMVSVNGLLLNQLKGMKTILKDNDRIIIMPVVSGG
jgi:molybdopterin converting factor small subunit